MKIKTHIFLKSFAVLLIILFSLVVFNSCRPIEAEDIEKIIESINNLEKTAEEGLGKIKTSVDEGFANSALATEKAKEIEDQNSTNEQEKIIFEVPVIEPGFSPDPDLIDISDEVNFPEIPQDLTSYRIFPDVESVWGKPRAGYNFGYNDAFRDVSRRANVQIPTWKWLVFTGEETWLPGIGSVKDPDGGAILVALINVWEIPGEFLNAYLLHGFWGVGEVWDMSDMADNEDYTDPEYGEYTLETLAILRNHYLNQLGSDEPNPEFRGQCGCAEQCETITWVAVLRWYDGSFRLVDSGQWIRNS